MLCWFQTFIVYIKIYYLHSTPPYDGAVTIHGRIPIKFHRTEPGQEGGGTSGALLKRPTWKFSSLIVQNRANTDLRSLTVGLGAFQAPFTEGTISCPGCSTEYSCSHFGTSALSGIGLGCHLAAYENASNLPGWSWLTKHNIYVKFFHFRKNVRNIHTAVLFTLHIILEVALIGHSGT